MNTNAYETLGLDKDCTQEEIQERYKELCEKFHPNSQSGEASPEKFDKVNKAYRVLKDAERREAYDILDSEIGGTPDTMINDFNKFISEEKPKSEEELEAFRAWVNPVMEEDWNDRTLFDFRAKREDDDIESKPERLFDGGDFNPELFNRVFDVYYEGRDLDGTIDPRTFGEIIEKPNKPTLKQTLQSVKKCEPSDNPTGLDTRDLSVRLEELMTTREKGIEPTNIMEYKQHPDFVGKGDKKLYIDDIQQQFGEMSS